MVWCFSTRASVATVLTTHPCLSRCLWVKCIVSTVSTSHQRMQYTPMTEGAINTLRPRQDGRHFPDDILKWIFLNENLLISIKISLKFVPMGPISNIPALVQIMAWRRPGDKPLSEPMMVSSPTHICITRPQWVNAGTTKILHKISSTILNNIIWSVQIRFQIVNNYETLKKTYDFVVNTGPTEGFAPLFAELFVAWVKTRLNLINLERINPY